MATIFLEGFDKYGPTPNSPTSQLLLQQEWSSAGNSSPITTSLNSQGGYGWVCGQNQGGLAIGLPSSYGRLIGGVRIQPTAGSPISPIWSIQLASVQNLCCLVVTAQGNLAFFTGAQNSGTQIARSLIGMPGNATCYIEWDITFGASSSYNIYKDGVSVFSGTGNTGNGQTTANRFILGSDGSNNTVACVFDDLYLFDSTGSFNNAVLLTSPVVITRYPSGDSQKQWTNGGNLLIPVGITQTGVASATSNTNGPGANTIALMKITPAVNCTLQSVGTISSNVTSTAKFKAVLYTDSAGSPNALTATGTEVTGQTTTTTITLPFGSGQSLTGGTSYWIGFITDSAFALNEYDSTTVKGQKANNTYGSGAPGTAPAMTTGQASWEIWGNATGAAVNWVSVAQDPASGLGPAADNGAITSSTSGNEDLYSFPALPGSVGTVHCIAVKANVKRADVGTRTLDLRLKSNVTDSAGNVSGQTLGSTYNWQGSYFDSDPNGSIAWTVTPANNATAGPKVAS